MNTLQVSAPGRICLFGEHQDYLGLPVIAAAVSLRIQADARRTEGRLLEVDMPDMGTHLTLDPAVEQEYEEGRDYLRSCINVLRRRGCSWPHGYAVRITSTIPIRAGVSSSSAMVVMWLRFLLEGAAGAPDVSDEELARLGHAAEVVEFGEPGGMMDHFCAAMGGVLHIDTRPPFGAERIQADLTGIVLGDSQQPKATIETLARARSEVAEGIRLIAERMPEFDLAATPLELADEHLKRLPREPSRRLRANLVNRDLTRRAMAAIARQDVAALGPLLIEHHSQLRDGLDLSTPRIEAMLEAALDAGALGGKINGSGGGGCMFAYAPGREAQVAEAIARAGGIPIPVTVDRGALVSPTSSGT